MNKGQTILDLPIIIITIILGFIILFTTIKVQENQFSNFLEQITITENATSKNNPEGVGFAKIRSNITLTNNIENIKLKEPIKEIRIYDLQNNLKLSLGSINCNKTIITRLVVYESETAIAKFTFCK